MKHPSFLISKSGRLVTSTLGVTNEESNLESLRDSNSGCNRLGSPTATVNSTSGRGERTGSPVSSRTVHPIANSTSWAAAFPVSPDFSALARDSAFRYFLANAAIMLGFGVWAFLGPLNKPIADFHPSGWSYVARYMGWISWRADAGILTLWVGASLLLFWKHPACVRARKIYEVAREQVANPVTLTPITSYRSTNQSRS